MSPIRTALTAVAKSVVFLYCTMLATSACAHPGPAITKNSRPASAIAAETLIVNLDDVRRITGYDYLKPNPDVDPDQPGRPNSEPPGACRVLDPTVAFGSDWTQFRSAVYNGFDVPRLPGPTATGPHAPAPAKPRLVMQSIGIYPDERAARTAFDRLAPALTACSALHAKHYDFTVGQPNSSTITLNHPSGSEDIFHVQSSALIYVAVGGFPQTDQIVHAILQNIVNRI
jgi:hypothetical protein